MIVMSKFLLFLLFCCFFSFLQANEKYIIYLTFDDGPLGGTENIIDVLKDESVHGTFFMVGKHFKMIKDKKKLLRKIKESQNILLGNHSYSHANGHYVEYYKNPKKVLNDMISSDEILEISKSDFIHSRLPGRDVFRLNGLSRDDSFIIKYKNNQIEKKVSDLLFENNYLLYGWDYEWQIDQNGNYIQSVDKVVKDMCNMLKNKKTFLKDKLILLMHDQMFRTDFQKNELKKLIQKIKEDGLFIGNLKDYLNEKSENIELKEDEIDLYSFQDFSSLDFDIISYN